MWSICGASRMAKARRYAIERIAWPQPRSAVQARSAIERGPAPTPATVRREEHAPMPNEKITAPMACSVVEVAVRSGETVDAGQLLLVVEAMKMEHEIRASARGRVVELLAVAGDAVGEGELLIRLDSATPEPA